MNNIYDGMRKEIIGILNERITHLVSQIEILPQSKIDAEVDVIYFLIVDVIKKYKTMGLKPSQAEEAIQGLFDVDINDKLSEIKTDILNEVVCTVVGFCSPHLLIWDKDD